MNMSIGIVNRAFSRAFLAFLLCAASGFAQRPQRATRAQSTPDRSAQRPRSRESQYVPNRYILFLRDEPVASRFTAHEDLQTAAAVAYRQQIESRQQSAIQDLGARNIKVVGSVSTVMNAIFVVAPPDRVADLRNVTGVIGVMPERRVKPSLNRATTLSNAPAAWAQAAIGGQANAGSGVKIGIFDTGIDQTHPAFSDTGFAYPTSGTWPKCGYGTTVVQSDCTNFTNHKVIVARSYVPLIAAGTGTNPAANSLPDDFSARDRDGHGSAVAAVAAAVQNSGGTVAFSGMAPKAWLGSYKIFGSDFVSGGASESVIIMALNDAVNDGMDVINMSSGAPAFTGALDDVQCGNPAGTPCDPLAKAFDTAAKAGLVITVSVGNSSSDPYYDFNQNYPYFNGISSPATAPSVIGVGATINSHVFNPSVSVAAAGAPAALKNMAADQSDYYPFLSGASTGALIDVTQLGNDGYACAALPAGSLTDKYALIQDGGSCSGDYDTKVTNAANAGAIGIILYMATSGSLFNPEGTEYGPGPVVIISLANGQALKTYIDANPGAAVTIDTAGSEQVLTSLVNTLASYSSVGPTPDGAIKPDMVATGGYDLYQFPDINDTYLPAPSGLYTVGQNYDPNGELFTTNRYAAANGTSFAAPLVAGAAALVKQAHPTWKGPQIKSALVNNSGQGVTADDFGDLVDVQWIGAGLLDANAAVTASVTAVPPSLSFGYLTSGVALPKPIAVTLTNNGSSSVTLAVAVKPGTALSTTTAATVTASPSSITIAAGATATLTVTLGGTVPVAGEYSGSVTLTSVSPAVALHLPYMFLAGVGPTTDGTANVVPLNVNLLEGGYLYGQVGQDLGPLPIQVVDAYGVPVAGQSVAFTVTPRGGVTLKPVPGVAGSSTATVPFVPSNCTPSSSSTSLTCTTNSYGIAWVEVVGGSTPYDVFSNPITIDAVAAGQDATVDIGLIPQPALTQIGDAAFGGTTIAPGSYVSLYGSNLVDPDFLFNTSGDSADTTLSSGRLPLTLDGVTVSFDAAATGSLPAISEPGYIYFVSPGQVNIYAPWELEGYSSVQMKVAISGVAFTNVLTVPVSNYTPAFLMYNSGSIFVADARDNNTGALIGPSNPATAGEVLQLYCNGLGPVSNQPASGDPAPGSPNLAQTSSKVTVSIGGVNAPVIFSGLTPPFVGLYLVDVTVPSGLTSGNQPITVTVNGKTSPTSVTASNVTYNIVLPIK